MKEVVSFCCGGKRCPNVVIHKDKVIIGGIKEGFTFFTIDNFKDFISSIKSGKFDSLIGDP